MTEVSESIYRWIISYSQKKVVREHVGNEYEHNFVRHILLESIGVSFILKISVVTTDSSGGC